MNDFIKLYENANTLPSKASLINKYTFLIANNIIKAKYMSVSDILSNNSKLNSYIVDKKHVLLIPNFISGNIVSMFVRGVNDSKFPLKLGVMKLQANEALDKVGLGHKKLSKVENLSWGESQRVAIARAVARKPSLILADEPTGNLDYDNAINILGLLKSFRNEKTTVIITTHATHLIKDEQNATFIDVNNGRITIERRYL